MHAISGGDMLLDKSAAQRNFMETAAVVRLLPLVLNAGSDPKQPAFGLQRAVDLS